jgi:hypothetical protein
MSAESLRLWLAHDRHTDACADQKATGEAIYQSRKPALQNQFIPLFGGPSVVTG